MRTRILAFFLLSAVSTPVLAQPARVLDPLTLPPAERQEALTARLGRYGPFGQPADPGCYWSRFETPTPQGLRWLLEEDCSDSTLQAPLLPGWGR